MQGNTIRDQMEALRTRSASSATELEAAVERLKDWREHVKAHPWLVGGAAMLAAYALVPKRNGAEVAPNGHNGKPTPESLISAVTGIANPGQGWTAGLARIATNFAVGLATNAVRTRMNSWSTQSDRHEAETNQALSSTHPACNQSD